MIRTKPKKCKQCGNDFKQMNSLQIVCSYQCALKFNSEAEIKKRVQEYKQNVQSLSQLESLAKVVFQKWIRYRDENLPCISCGTNTSNQWDGSHYFKAEIYSGVIFNELNVNKSCSYCNKWLDGNLINYRKGLIEKYGVLAVEGLEQLANETRQYKYNKDELNEIINTYKLKLKQGEK